MARMLHRGCERSRWALLASAGLCVSFVLGAGVLQAGQSQAAGEQADKQPQKPTEASEATEDRSVVRERLTRRLDETRERISRYQSHEQGLVDAIERLDAGESPQAISDDMLNRVQGQMRPERGGLNESRDGDMRDSPRRRGPLPPLDAESRERVLSMLRVQSPELHKEVSSISKSGSTEQVDRMIRRLAPKIEEIRRAQDSDPELANLLIFELHANLNLTILSRDHRQVLSSEPRDEVAIAQSQAKISEALRISFDAHLALKEHEVAQLETRLADLREEIERRRGMRDEFIDRQIDRAGSPTPTFRRHGSRG